MAQRRFHVPKGRTADGLITAFYRFLEMHSRTTVDDDGLCSVHSEFEGPNEVRVLSFWSERAASEFVLFWEDFRRADERPGEVHSLDLAAPPWPRRRRPSGLPARAAT